MQNDDQNSAAVKSLDQEDIFDVLGAGNISDEEKAVLVAKMVDLIERRTLEKILDTLDDDAAQHLEDDVLAKDEDPNALQAFLDKYVPNYESMFDAEARELRRELITSMSV